MEYQGMAVWNAKKQARQHQKIIIGIDIITFLRLDYRYPALIIR